MQHLEVSCAVRRFFKSLGFKGLIISRVCRDTQLGFVVTGKIQEKMYKRDCLAACCKLL